VSPVGHQVVSELDFTGAGVDERSLVVVDMQGDHDEEAVNQALRAGPAYIGLVRSGRGRSLCSTIWRVQDCPTRPWLGGKIPVALDVGRVSTREIAVGVLAELVRPRAGGELVRGVWPARPEVAEVIDPVCGVTVDVGSARHKMDHEWGHVLLLLSGDAPGH
jgi:xanthine dehydrogenase accessory factor